MQRQSASIDPGIATAPRSVVQIPMADGEHTGFPQVSAPASAAVHEEEEENNEDEEAGNSDDDEDMDDINHTALPKEVVRPNTPTMRPQTADIWKHVSRIAKHDVPDRAMKTECTHVCVYRLDDEDGEKRYCNTPLKLFRASSATAAPWSTSAALAHFKKKHEHSSSARKQKAGAGIVGLDDASFNVLGLRCSQIVNAVVSDRAALSVGRNRDVFPLYQVDTAACLMHDMDKPQASALGKLIRSSKRVQVNPFPEGISLVKKAHALGVHFSYSNRLDILHKHCATVKCAAIKVQLDLNDTRVPVQHGLFLSLIRMMPALVLYLSQYTGENVEDMDLTKEEWKDLIVQEAVLDAMRLTTVLPQYEKHLNRAFGPLYKELTIKTLRNHTLWIIDKKQLCTNTGPRPTRKEVCVINLSAVGQETRRRALLECERRFCVNRTEQLNGSVVVKSNHELVCMGLDLRLYACNHLVKAEAAEVQQPAVAGFFAPRAAAAAAAAAAASVGPAVGTAPVGLNEAPAPQYDLIGDLLHADMFKVLSDMLRSEALLIQRGKSAKFGYLPMMAVATLGALNAESFCERVLSCVKLVVSDLHVSLKAEEIRMLVMLRMNRGFMEYMRSSYPDTPLSEFRAVDTYVRAHGGVETLEDDEDDE